ncbi:MAG: DUF5666 domain-containing protein [Chloroflexota bacterium]|nr:DUF5666 domain-containing protein [Chloroflexota bacterium]
MRRNGIRALLAVLVIVGIAGTGFAAYGRGKTAGQHAAASDRTVFGQARGTTVAGGAGGFGGQSGQGGQATSSGQRVSGTGSPNGSATAGGGSALAGKVTKVDNGTLTLQEQVGTTTTVTTAATTTVSTFAPAALSDLAVGDTVALQGDKTGDTAYTAKTIFALNGQQGRGAPGQAAGGADTATGTAAAGSPTGGGRNRGPGGAGGGFPGLNGPTGRITQINGGTLIVQGFDGTMTTVTTNASTSVRKQAQGAVSDIKVGDTISVQGDPSAPARAITDLGAVT